MGILLFLMHLMIWQHLISKFMMINTIMLSLKEVWSFLEKSPQVKMKYFIGLSSQTSVPSPPAWLASECTPNGEFRRLYFKKQYELLKSINPAWAEKKRKHFIDILVSEMGK